MSLKCWCLRVHLHVLSVPGMLWWADSRPFSTNFRSLWDQYKSAIKDNGSMYEGVVPLDRVKILRNQPKLASLSPANALWEQSLSSEYANQGHLHMHISYMEITWLINKQIPDLTYLEQLATLSTCMYLQCALLRPLTTPFSAILSYDWNWFKTHVPCLLRNKLSAEDRSFYVWLW